MMKTLIRILRSIRLAIGLILVLAIVSLIGIFIPQIPPELSASPEGYAWWIENVAYGELGELVYMLGPLGLFRIFHSFWFIGASVLLMLNILVCSICRVGTLRTGSRKAVVNSDADFYKQGKYIYESLSTLPIEELGEVVRVTLKRYRYSINEGEKPGNINFAGDKHNISTWGGLFVHLSLLLIVIGVLAGALFGFHNDSFVIVEGSTRSIGNETGLSIHLKSFTDEYWSDGTPKDYRSVLDIYKNDEIVQSGIVRVNHPLVFQGIRIHQGSFGPAVKLQVSDAAGNVVFKDNVVMAGMKEEDSLKRPEGVANLPGSGYNIIILGSAVNGADPYISEDETGIEFYDESMGLIGWLVLDNHTPQQLGELYFSVENMQYSGFMVSKDPRVPFVWTAAFLFLFGLGMKFYFPHRKIWIRLYALSKDHTEIVIKFGALKEYGIENESSKIAEALGLEEKPEGSR